MDAQSSASPLWGAWDLTITTPKGDLPSWIQISDKNGHPYVLMVGTVDHATPLAHYELHGRDVQFLSPKGEEGFASDLLFKGQLIDDHLVGTATDPAGTSWKWRGERAPALKRTNAPRWGRPISLFNGKSLAGWSLLNPNKPGTWKAQDGTLTTTGRGSDLVHAGLFEDFKLHLEFKCGASANSGVYLRGRYELQIETDSAAEPQSHHTGGIYGFLAPAPEQPRLPGAWQSFDITLIGRTLTVVQGGVVVIDQRTIPGITGGALDSHEELPGPIMLQGTEKGEVSFRNIVLTPAVRAD